MPQGQMEGEEFTGTILLVTMAREARHSLCQRAPGILQLGVCTGHVGWHTITLPQSTGLVAHESPSF